MERNLDSLLVAVCDLKLEYHKINDVTVSDEQYEIGFEDFKGGDFGICLNNSKKVSYGLSDYQLTALRIVQKKEDVTCKYVGEFNDLPAAERFQTIARKMREDKKSLASVKFEVVAQLQIPNEQVPGASVYRSKYYTGHAAYLKGLNDFKVGKGKDYYKLPEYGIKRRELSEIMHATAVRDGKAIPANLELIPVFKIIGI